jgi:hypothetical protein
MKKFIVLLLAGLLISAFGTTVYAQPKLEFKASGFIDAVTNLYENVTPGNAAGTLYGSVHSSGMPAVFPATNEFNRTASWVATRARLKFDAIMEKNLSGTIYFEFDSTRWGETTPAADQRNALGVWSGDRGAAELKNIYFDFGLPYFGIPVPMTVRAGLQPLAIRPNILVYTDGMGITGGLEAGPVKIQPLWFKALEGKDAAADDVDVYGLHANAKVSTFTIGGYGLWYNMNTYPFNQVTFTYGAAAPSFNSSMWWFGGYADGKAGPVNLNLDFIYDTGEVKANGRFFSGPFSKVDYSGWLGRVKLDYPWEKFNFGVVGMYATGADQKKTDATGYPGRVTPWGLPTRDVGSYVTPPGSEAAPIFGESLVVYSCWINRGTTGIGANWNYNALSRGGLGGTWLAKLYGSYKAASWAKITLQGLYVGDTTKNGDTLGTAVDSFGFPHDGKTIGWELDLFTELEIYKNLKFVPGFGYLFAGSALKYNNGVANVNPHNPWILMTALTYNF